MSSSTCAHLLLVTLALLAFLIAVRPSHARLNVKISDDELKNVCSIALDPTFCVQILKSDPRTAKANLPGVLGIAIDIALDHAKQTSTLVDSLLKTTTEIPLKKKYSDCFNFYGSAVKDLEKATDSFNFGEYLSAATFAEDAENETKNCEAEFNAPPFDDPPVLDKKNEEQRKLSDIINSIVLQVTKTS